MPTEHVGRAVGADRAERRERPGCRHRASGRGMVSSFTHRPISGRFSTSSMRFATSRLAIRPQTSGALVDEQQRSRLQAELLEAGQHDRRGRRRRQAERQQRHQRAGGRGVVGGFGTGDALDGAMAELLGMLREIASRPNRTGSSRHRRRRPAWRRSGSRSPCRAATASRTASSPPGSSRPSP